jgi:hypothetical protein
MKTPLKDERRSRSLHRAGRRVGVRLSEKDWIDLVNFVGGDMANMEEGCPIKAQMRRISETILRAVYQPTSAKHQ